jgi:hypothetical protein
MRDSRPVRIHPNLAFFCMPSSKIVFLRFSPIPECSLHWRTKMANIRVNERTSLDDLREWQLQSCEVFRVSRRSGFEPGVQGVALSMLASLRPGVSVPQLECDFEEPLSIDDLDSNILGTAFGFALARFTNKIRFSSGPASQGLKRLLAEYYKLNGGVVGRGSAVSIICPDPVYSLPPVLSQDEKSTDLSGRFPPPSVFGSLLSKIVKRMGFSRALESTDEASIVAFIYEALRNSWEHGLAIEPHRRAKSTRALIIEKIVLQHRDVSERNLSPELKEYLERIVQANGPRLGLGVLCLTVADQGDGIQSTLPARPDLRHEAAEERLARAFQPGESRKPAGMVKRGLGLPSVVTAAHHLQALLRLTSGDLSAVQDFSLGETKYPSLKFDRIQRMPQGFRCGTAITIFVPESLLDRDQRLLFADQSRRV